MNQVPNSGIITFIQELHSGLIFEADLLDQVFEVELGNLVLFIYMPSLNSHQLHRLPNLSVPSGFSHQEGFDINRSWGSITRFENDSKISKPNEVCINSFLVLCIENPDSLSEPEIRNEWDQFWSDLIERVEISSHQDSKNGSIISQKGIVRRFYKSTDQVISPGSLHVEVGAQPMIAGKTISVENFLNSIGSVTECVPVREELKFLRRSRYGFHESDFRRCVIEAATAQEILISRLLREKLAQPDKDVFHLLGLSRRGLGELLKNWKSLGGWLPQRQNKQLTDLRNKVVHEALTPTKEQALEYYETTRELLEYFV